MTCLILTRNRPRWLPLAVQCARLQTYKRKEILILADGEDVRDVAPNDPAIRYVYRPNFGTIGAKRNAGCHEANGDIIAHFDDDDFSAPTRLADQVDRLLASGMQAAGYHTLRFTDGVRWWRYHLRPDYAPGTTLCYWKSFWEQNKFPDQQVNEDGAFVNRARGVITCADAGELMFATNHGQNTSPRTLNPKQWTEIAA